MKRFNMNNYVHVKLTEEAVAELKKQHDELYEYIGKPKEFTPPSVDENGLSKFQLHTLFSKLGHMCTIGSDSPFELCDIYFDDNYLQDVEK